MAFPNAGELGSATVQRGQFRTLIENFLAATKAATAHGRQAFTASGSFTVPDNVTTLYARVIGGGGGGGGSWHTGNALTANAGGTGGTSSIVRSGSALLSALGGQGGTPAISTRDGYRGAYSNQGYAAPIQSMEGGNVSMLPPYGAGGNGGNLLPWQGYFGGPGGGSVGVFGVLTVAAGQVLTITVGGGGAGGVGSSGGMTGTNGNAGIILLEW